MKYEKHSKRLAEIFCADGGRKITAQPNQSKDGNFWLATDAHAMVIIPSQEITKSQSENFIDLEGLLKRGESISPISIGVNVLSDALQCLESKEGFNCTYEECKNEDCDGGVVECECCGNEKDCDDCEGNGQILLSRIPNGLLEYNQLDYVKILSGVFNPNLLHKVAAAIKEMGFESEPLTITHNSNKTFTLIQVKDVRFIIMPVMCKDDTEIKSTVNFSSHQTEQTK